MNIIPPLKLIFPYTVDSKHTKNILLVIGAQLILWEFISASTICHWGIAWKRELGSEKDSMDSQDTSKFTFSFSCMHKNAISPWVYCWLLVSCQVNHICINEKAITTVFSTHSPKTLKTFLIKMMSRPRVSQLSLWGLWWSFQARSPLAFQSDRKQQHRSFRVYTTLECN